MPNEYNHPSRTQIQAALKDPWARIPAGFESQYYAYQQHQTLKYLLQVNLFAQVAYASYTIADCLVLSDIQSLLIVSKLSYTCFAVLITIWLYQHSRHISFFDMWLPCSIMGASAIWFYNLNQSNSPDVLIYQYSSLVFIVLSNLCVQVRFRPALIISLCTTAIIYVGVYFNTKQDHYQIFLFSLIYLPVFLFSLYISWNATLKSRLVFLQHTLNEFNRIIFEKLAHTDALTGLSNRRSFERQANIYLQRNRNDPHPMCLIIFDVDHFKKINDQFGHDFGDQVLQSIAHIAQSFIREDDLLARFGGEEFTILLPHTRLNDGYTIAERLRLAIEDNQSDFCNGVSVRYTISIGIAEITPEFTHLKPVFQFADSALYQAKATGRNKICTYSNLKLIQDF
jgi:diguanylate cyclase (GGDEF)-like protein